MLFDQEDVHLVKIEFARKNWFPEVELVDPNEDGKSHYMDIGQTFCLESVEKDEDEVLNMQHFIISEWASDSDDREEKFAKLETAITRLIELYEKYNPADRPKTKLDYPYKDWFGDWDDPADWWKKS